MMKPYEDRITRLTADLATESDPDRKAEIEAHLQRFQTLRRLRERKADPAPSTASNSTPTTS